MAKAETVATIYVEIKQSQFRYYSVCHINIYRNRDRKKMSISKQKQNKTKNCQSAFTFRNPIHSFYE